MAQLDQGRYSYSSATRGVGGRLKELTALMSFKLKQSQSSEARYAVDSFRTIEERVRAHSGLKLQGLKALEIGPGQLLANLHCLAIENDAVGIDLDVLSARPTARDLLHMLRKNTPMRALKTLGRKAIGVDRRFHTALAQLLHRSRLLRPQLLRMSATEMSFADASFDFVHSHSVFEHVDEPGRALREVRRVLRPGGVSYISLHLYTSHSGSHDLSAMFGAPTAPLWPHLRPEHAHLSRANCYLNKIRLAEWQKLFAEVMPGAHFMFERDDHPALVSGARELAGRALGEFSEDELLTVNVIAIWQKPL